MTSRQGAPIDLAPGHKHGLVVQSPVLLGAGSAGGGEAIHPELDLRHVGALVVGPVSLQSRPGAPMPRVVELDGGALLNPGGQNRGLEATVREFAPLWKRLGIPVVVQLGETEPAALARLGGRLAEVRGVGGLELPVPERWSVDETRRVFGILARAVELPLWAKLPLARAVELAGAAVDGGAAGLVVGSALRGAELSGSDLRRGSLHSPGLFPVVLDALAGVAALKLPAALIAAGGIHSIAQAEQALAAGAAAIQLEAIVWLEPQFPGLLAAALASGGRAGSG